MTAEAEDKLAGGQTTAVDALDVLETGQRKIVTAEAKNKLAKGHTIAVDVLIVLKTGQR